MDHQEPELLVSIIDQTHMEDIEGSVGNWFGFMTTNAITFGPDLGDDECQTFSLLPPKKCTHGPPGAKTTLQHHSLDPYGGYWRVWRQLVWFCNHKCHHFWSSFDDESQTFTFSQLSPKNWHGLAPMDHQEPELLFSIIDQTHMEDIEGSWGSWYDFMTTKAITLGPDLLMSAKLSASRCSPKLGMSWHLHPLPLFMTSP
jgi:hypothetical protein